MKCEVKGIQAKVLTVVAIKPLFLFLRKIVKNDVDFHVFQKLIFSIKVVPKKVKVIKKIKDVNV
jgi:hypothetical protein